MILLYLRVREMGEQGLIAFIKRLFHDHPFISSTGILLCILYRFFPCTFSWIISTLPVFICTALLLGTLLCYGEPHIPEIEVDEKQSHEISCRNIDNNEICYGALSIPKPPSSSKTFVIKRGYSVRRLGRNSSLVDANRDNTSMADDRKEINGICADPYKNGSKNNSSDSEAESEHSDNSITEASVADGMPALDEFHPLLEPEPRQLDHKSAENSYAPSRASSQNRESDDSGGEETENQEEAEDEEEETQEEKDDGSDGVVKWTADDQKNLMDLGTSELERNQRLENLIAKRRARQIQRVDTEKNLIDFDSNDPAPIVEELSRLLVNVPPISIGRRNPFDLPAEPDIPGSAPTKLTMRNPFDLPFDQDLTSNYDAHIEGESSRPPEPVQVQQRDAVFRRHESFTVGPSFFSHSNTIIRPSRFHLAAEPTQQEEAYSERNDSKMRSAAASESSSLAGDGAANKEHSENNEGGFGSPAYHNPQHVGAEDVGGESHYSDEDDSGDEQERIRHNVAGYDHRMDLNTSDVIEDNHHIDDGSEGEEENEGVVEVALESEVINVKYDDQASSASSEANDRNVDMQTGGEVFPNVEGTRNVSPKGSINSVQSVITESEILSSATEKVVDGPVVDPIYDSSPSALEKTLSNSSALDVGLFHGRTESLNSATFLPSDMQMEMSEVDTPRPTDKSFLSGDEGSISSNGSIRKGMASGSVGAWVASSNLSSVEENESRTREVTEVRELDVIQVGFSAFPEDFSTPTAHLMPYSPAVWFGHHPSFASVRTESSEYSSMDEDVSSASEGGDEMATGRDVVCDYTVKFVPDMQQRAIEESQDN